MKKALFILFLNLLLISPKSFSQAPNYAVDNFPFTKGYIYLKNGEILKGKYIYSVDLKKIQIITKNETLVLDADEVVRITKDKPVSEKKSKEQKTDTSVSYEPRKFFNITDLGWLIGNPDNNVKYPFIAHTSFNYSFVPGFSAGMGLGIEFYKETYLPIHANIMYKFGKKQMKPYVSLQGGYNFPINGSNLSVYNVAPRDLGYSSYYPYYNIESLDAKGGFLVNPSLGFIYQVSEGLGLGLSLGYRYHQLNYKTDSEYNMQVGYNRLSLKVSFIFN